MSINDVFDIAIQLEEKMSECYKEISQLCQNESISKELMTLSRDEMAHMNLLITGKNYLKEAPYLFTLESERLTEMKIGLDRVIRLIDNIHINSLLESLDEIIELERFFEQFHLKTIAEVKAPSLKKLFEALSTGDKEHKERLIKIKSALS